MNLRQAVTLCVLVGGPNVLPLEPAYLMEKVRACEGLAVPEVILDGPGRETFNQYAEMWEKDWDRERDLSRPMSEVLEEQIGG